MLGPDNKPLGVIFSGQDVIELTGQKHNMIRMIGTGALVALGVGLLLTFLLAKRMTQPISELVESVGKVAAGDLTQQVAVNSRDEIGLLSNGFNSMVEKLRALVLQVNTMTETLAASSQELTASAQQSADAANQVAGSITEIANGTESQAKSAAQIATVAEKISASAQQISILVRQISEIVKGTTTEAEQGQQAVEQAVDQMKRIGEGSGIV